MSGARIRQYAGCTLNNYTPDEIEAIWNLDEDQFKWAIFAMEVGESGTPHIQAAWQLKNGKSWSAMSKLLESNRWHFEKREGSEHRAWCYCAKGEQPEKEWKAEKENGENWGLNLKILREIGEMPEKEIKAKNQWDDIREMIEDGASDMEICAVYPQEGIRCRSAIRNYRLMWQRAHADWRDVKVHYIWGETGTGKTRAVMQKYGYPNVYRVTDYNSGSFDQYDGQDVLVFEEFRSSFRLEQMLNYLDGHPVELPCRYANQLLMATEIFIITNIPLSEQYASFQDSFASTGKRNSFAAFERRITDVIEWNEDSVL